MDIDRKLLSRAVTLLRETRDVIERVRFKAEDYEEAGDEEVMNDLLASTNNIDLVVATLNKITKED
jgi:hypothetical protein